MALKAYYPTKVEGLYPRSVSEQAWNVLKTHLDPDVEFLFGEEIPDPADFHILIAGRPTREQLEASLNLQNVIVPWAGISDSTLELLKQFPHLTLHNLHHNAAATGETALMLLFTAAKRIIPIERKFREHDWTPRYQPNPALLLKGKAVLLLGFGNIGENIARVCQAMGMKILAIRRNPDIPTSEDIRVEIYSSADLHQVLPRAEVLMISLPLTEETEGMIGAEELALLPDNAILVNVGRGPVVDQEALYYALKDSKLHSAGIDVWYNYPPDPESRSNTLPADFPFHELDNVVMSPHRGGGAAEIDKLRMAHLAKLLNAANRNEPIPNQVDLTQGY
jgi:phosphoglycerate dehydrogenase-like enzyme